MSTALALAALAARSHAQTFTTDLKGLGGTPIGLTPLNAPDTSLMSVNYVTDSDPEVRVLRTRGCSRAARDGVREGAWNALSSHKRR